MSSPSFNPTLVGTYRWIASYSGDANNPAVSGLCNDPNESVLVIPAVAAALAITSVASPTITAGTGVLSDTATVSGRVNPVAGATITFRLYGPDDATCTTIPIFTSTLAYPVAGGPVTSGTFGPPQSGAYRWVATYNGDANNLPITGLCNAQGENTTVLVAAAALPIPALSPLVLLLLVIGIALAGLVGVKRSH